MRKCRAAGLGYGILHAAPLPVGLILEIEVLQGLHMVQQLEQAVPRRQCRRYPLKSLLEAGVHFGHQKRRWNPKMRQYIFAHRNGIHIIDLQQDPSAHRESVPVHRGHGCRRQEGRVRRHQEAGLRQRWSPRQSGVGPSTSTPGGLEERSPISRQSRPASTIWSSWRR